MSIAAELSRHRLQLAPPPIPTSSLPRRQLAAVALNGIDALAPIDPTLRTLIPGLLLNTPHKDRATLDTEEQAAVSEAIVKVVRRLSGVLAVRHAQKVLRWIVEGLGLFQRWEVDAVIRCLLPWGGCDWFAAVVVKVLGGGGRGVGVHWVWLEGVAKGGGLAGVGWMKEACPVALWWDVVKDGVDMAVEGVNIGMLARFVAVVGVAKMVHIRYRDRAQWVARVLDLVARSKGKDDSELMFGLVMCVSAAVWAGVDTDVGEVVVRVMAGACANWKTGLRECAIECLGIAVERGNRVRSPEVAMGVLKGEGLGERVCTACVEGLMEGRPGVMVVNGVALGLGELGPTGVKNVAVGMLRMFSQAGEVEFEEAQVRQGLVEVLGRLGRGKHADSFDEGLREHFANRKGKGHGRYDFVDSVLAEALVGTPYQVLKTEMGNDQVVAGTAMAMMLHPEMQVRIAALEKVKECLEGEWDVALIERCVDMVKEDPKVAVASCAAECLLTTMDNGRGTEFLQVIASRFRKELHAFEKKKKKKSTKKAHVDSLAKNAFLACKRLIGEDPVAVTAVLIGLLIDERVCHLATDMGMSDDVKSVFCTQGPFAEITKDENCLKKDLYRFLTAALEALVSKEGFECEPLVRALARWDKAQSIAVLRIWLRHLRGTPDRRDPILARSLLEGIRTVAEKNAGNPTSAHDVIELAVAPLCSLTQGESASRTAEELWGLVCATDSVEFQATALRSLKSSIGLENTLQLLRRVILETEESPVNSAVKSLKWFMGLSENHSDPECHRDAILVALCTFYGDNEALRREMKRICRTKGNRRQRSGDYKDQVFIMRQCLRKIADLSTIEIASFKPVKDAEDVSISLNTLAALREQTGHSLPLVSSDSTVKSVRFIFRFAMDKIMERSTSALERLYLLRAIEGFDIAKGSIVEKLLRLLQIILEADIPSPVRAETMLRVSHLLTPKKYKSLCRDSVSDSIRYFASRLEAFADDGYAEEAGLLDVQNAIVMVTGQLLPLFQAVSQSHVKGDSPNAKTHHTLLALLLTVSVKSSPAGRCARAVLDRICRGRVDILVPFVGRFVGDHHPSSKKQRREPGSEDEEVQKIFTNAAGQGGIETLRRLLSSASNTIFQQKRPALQRLLSSTWNFVAEAMSKCGKKTEFLEEDQEYQLQVILDVLILLHGQEAELRKEGDKKLDKVKLDALIKATFYAVLAGEEYQTALRLGIRRTALRLADTLTTLRSELVCAKLSQAVNGVVRQKASVPLQFLQSFAPVLIRSGCDFRLLSNWLSEAAYLAGGKAGTSAHHRQIIASCCHLAKDPESAAAVCVEEFAKKALDYLSLPTAAQESSHVLLSTNSSLLADLAAISQIDGKVRCQLASFYFLQTEFQSKLDVAVTDTPMDFDELVTSFSKLYQALLQSADSSENEAIAAVLGILPLRALTTCVMDSLTESSPQLVARALASLLNRLKAREVELSYLWQIGEGNFEFDPSMQIEAEGAFLSGVGTVLCEIIEEKTTSAGREEENDDEANMMRMALECLQVLSDRIGSSLGESLLKFSAAPCSVISSGWAQAAMSEPAGHEQHAMCIATALRCLAFMVKRLGNEAIAFVPKTVAAAVGVLTSPSPISKQRSPIPSALMESSAFFCKTVLERMPRLFGRNAVQTMARVVLSRNVRLCNEIFFQAVDSVPSGVSLGSLSAVSAKLRTVDVRPMGMVTLLKGVSAVVVSMTRSELKRQRECIMRIGLNIVEFCYESNIGVFSSGETSGAEGNVVEGHRGRAMVEEAFAEAMTNLVLKLSETGFKDLFRQLVVWLDAGRLPEAMSTISFGSKSQIYRNMTRAIPFLRLSLRLLRTLQSLYVPYFFQLLDQVLDIVGNGREESRMIFEGSESEDENRTKKRKRGLVEKEEKEETLRQASLLVGDLFNLGLDNLRSFLRQELNNKVLTGGVVGKIQASLLSAFDKQHGDTEELRAAFVGLATRVVAVGSVQESREESRTLLMGLVRELLGRTRESEVDMRAGALRVCRAVAGEVGDEVLVCLPEVMVVLAEVVDDEDGGVRAECDDLIRVFEGLGGEGIRESLRS